MLTLTFNDMRERNLTKAAEDRYFRVQLISGSKAVVSARFGVFIPKEFNVQVYEESVTAAHIVLPPSSRLTEEDMVKVAGGDWRTTRRERRSGTGCRLSTYPGGVERYVNEKLKGEV